MEQRKATIIFDEEDSGDMKDQSTVERVEFNTSVRLDHHTRNVLKAMTILGISQNQSSAVQIMEKAWRSTLNDSDKKSLDNLVDILGSSER